MICPKQLKEFVIACGSYDYNIIIYDLKTSYNM
jgi:hypothetical protein